MTGIIVGVDGSTSSRRALRWAAEEAEIRGEPLTAILAWGFFDHRELVDGLPFDPELAVNDAQALLTEIVAEALGADAGRVNLQAPCDLASAALISAAKDASLLVVGTRGRGGFAGLRLGSVSRKCLHHARGPIAVVPDRAPADGGRTIVVGVNGSAGSEAALRWAVQEAQQRQAPLTIVHAWDLAFPAMTPYEIAAVDPARLEQQAKERIERSIARVPGAGTAVVHLAQGGPAASLLAEAEGAALVVVGTRGLGAVAGGVVGSVSSQVVRHAPCPIVVVPERWS